MIGNAPEFDGSIGLIFMSALDNWKELLIYSMEIVNGKKLGSNSAFSMELFAILVALSILCYFRLPSTIYSDCEAAIKSVNNLSNGSKRIRSTTRDASMLSSAVNLLRDQDTLLRWTKGHPENVDRDADNWTKEMWGNHLSDDQLQECSGETQTTSTMGWRQICSLFSLFLPWIR